MDNRVCIAACDDYALAGQAVLKCLEAFGGACAILNGRKKVLIKPNLVMPRNPDAAATTHPAVVEAVCRAFADAGAEVGVIDSTAIPHTQATLKTLYTGCGIEAAVRRAGATPLYDTALKYVDFQEGVRMKRFHLLEPVVDAELVVTVGKVKTHGFTAYSGAVKNLFGSIPGLEKSLLHKKFSDLYDFGEMLVDLCECVSPGFAVLDGIVGMEGQGPTGGTPKKLGAVLGGFNPYAVDLMACRMIGVRHEKVLHLCAAQKRGLAPDYDRLELLGDDPAPLMTVFRPAGTPEIAFMPTVLHTLLPKRLTSYIRKRRAPWPIIRDKCVGCGECARVCPQQIITIDNRVALIRYDNCIKCYCCHEFCPARAVDYGARP